MSRRLAKLLGESEQTIANLISKLEGQNGHPSHDARHIAETHQAVRRKLADLNLDPDDTTAEELYHALRTRFESDAEKLDDFYDAASKTFDERSALAAQLVNKTMRTPELWTLKKSASKDLSRRNTPKHVMKAAGYRSVESMLKREDARTIDLAAQILESDSWHKAQTRLISKLDQAAFELRSVSAVSLKSDWLESAPSQSLLISSDIQGAVAVPPGNLTGDLPLLSIILLLADKIHSYGANLHDICKIYQTLGWWADVDGLIASLDGHAVSMNLKDVSASWLYGHEFKDRQLDSGRQNYWQNLVARYVNKEQVESVFDQSVMQRVRQLRVKAPEPVFEYDFAEDFLDG